MKRRDNRLSRVFFLERRLCRFAGFHGFIVTLFVLVGFSYAYSRDITVMPEMTTKVLMSNMDINRVVCPTAIEDVIYSKEKGVVVNIKGRNAFVKFLVKKEAEDIIYRSEPTDFFVLCGGDVYTLIAEPDKIPSRTIHLSSGKLQKIRQNRSFFKDMAFENKVGYVIKTLYNRDIPDSFSVMDKHERYPVSDEMVVVLKHVYSIEGTGLRVREFIVEMTGSGEKMTISEKDFLKADLSVNPVALALTKLYIHKGDPVRLFIVEKSNDE